MLHENRCLNAHMLEIDVPLDIYIFAFIDQLHDVYILWYVRYGRYPSASLDFLGSF